MIVAYVPDLMDRSRVSAASPGVGFAGSVDELVRLAGADDVTSVVVDLGRAEVRAVLDQLPGAKVVAFGSHVDREVLEAARAAGCRAVMARSAFFGSLADVLGH